jgi:hypothetical protein
MSTKAPNKVQGFFPHPSFLTLLCQMSSWSSNGLLLGFTNTYVYISSRLQGLHMKIITFALPGRGGGCLARLVLCISTSCWQMVAYTGIRCLKVSKCSLVMMTCRNSNKQCPSYQQFQLRKKAAPFTTAFHKWWLIESSCFLYFLWTTSSHFKLLHEQTHQHHFALFTVKFHCNSNIVTDNDQ